MNDTYYTVEDWHDVWFKTDDEGYACQFVQDRADEDLSYGNLRVIRHQNGKRTVIYRASERITEMYSD